MSRLPSTSYLAFPMRLRDVAEGAEPTSRAVAVDGLETCVRREHVRDLIEQLLFTNPGERVFRPEFGAGLNRLVFEPNAEPMWELTRKRILTALVDILRGEVDPRTIEVEVTGCEEGSSAITEKLTIIIRYELSAIGASEEHVFSLGGGANG
jgi:uncharacterized protein